MHENTSIFSNLTIFEDLLRSEVAKMFGNLPPSSRVCHPRKRTGGTPWRRVVGAFASANDRPAVSGQIRSLRAFSGMILITLRAGLALIMIGCLVAGLNPGRALVAGLCTTLIL